MEMLTLTDLKIWGFSSFAIAMNLMDVDALFSLCLTIAALGYTLHKWYLMYKKHKK